MIPLILGAPALATGAFGAVKGAKGIGNMNQAKEIGEQIVSRYKNAFSKYFQMISCIFMKITPSFGVIFIKLL